jgi:hypothetical protein
MGMAINYDAIRHEHFALTHNWDLVINGLPSVLSPLVQEYGTTTGGVNLNCENVSGLPNSSIGAAEINIRNTYNHQLTGRGSSVQSITFTVQELHDYRFFCLFKAWESIAVNRFTGAQNQDAKVKNGIYIVQYNSDRQSIMQVYHLYDTCCMSSVLGGTYGSTAELGTTDITLQCGNWHISKDMSLGDLAKLIGRK